MKILLSICINVKISHNYLLSRTIMYCTYKTLSNLSLHCTQAFGGTCDGTVATYKCPKLGHKTVPATRSLCRRFDVQKAMICYRGEKHQRPGTFPLYSKLLMTGDFLSVAFEFILLFIIFYIKFLFLKLNLCKKLQSTFEDQT